MTVRLEESKGRLIFALKMATYFYIDAHDFIIMTPSIVVTLCKEKVTYGSDVILTKLSYGLRFHFKHSQNELLSM
ncbi:hypothetical protein [Lysinibacillus sp. NPDC096259]|uniref:hypothetical protein n=1 Tax=Lysinibacillus sp. NPDC096259 TaxID=3390583 RepID=UPI003D037E72